MTNVIRALAILLLTTALAAAAPVPRVTLWTSRTVASDAYYRAYPVDLGRGVTGDLLPSRMAAYPSGVFVRWRLGHVAYHLVVRGSQDEALKIARRTIANLRVVQRPSSLRPGPLRAAVLARRIEPAFLRELPMLRRQTRIPLLLPSGSATRGLTLVNAWTFEDDFSYWLSRKPGIDSSYHAVALVTGSRCGQNPHCGGASARVDLGRGQKGTLDEGSVFWARGGIQYRVNATYGAGIVPNELENRNRLALRIARSIVANLP